MTDLIFFARVHLLPFSRVLQTKYYFLLGRTSCLAALITIRAVEATIIDRWRQISEHVELWQRCSKSAKAPQL